MTREKTVLYQDRINTLRKTSIGDVGSRIWIKQFWGKEEITFFKRKLGRLDEEVNLRSHKTFHSDREGRPRSL